MPETSAALWPVCAALGLAGAFVRLCLLGNGSFRRAAGIAVLGVTTGGIAGVMLPERGYLPGTTYLGALGCGLVCLAVIEIGHLATEQLKPRLAGYLVKRVESEVGLPAEKGTDK